MIFKWLVKNSPKMSRFILVLRQSKIALCVDILIQDIGLKNASHWRLWGNLVHISFLAVVGRGKILLVMAHIHPHLGGSYPDLPNYPEKHWYAGGWGGTTTREEATPSNEAKTFFAVETALFYRALIGWHSPLTFVAFCRLGFWYSHRHFMDDSSNIRLEVVDFAFCPQGCGSYLGPLWIPKGRGNPVALSLSAMLVHSWVHWEPNSAPTCSDYGTFARRMGSHGGLFNKKDQRKDNGKEAMPC